MSEVQDDYEVSYILAMKTLKNYDWLRFLNGPNSQTTLLNNGSRWNIVDTETAPVEALETRFLVKWKNLSYIHCSWEFETDIREACGSSGIKALDYFMKSFFERDLPIFTDLGLLEYFPPEFMEIERIIDMVEADEGIEHAESVPIAGVHSTNCSATIKWRDLPYSFSTFEDIHDIQQNNLPYLKKLLQHRSIEAMSAMTYETDQSPHQLFLHTNYANNNQLYDYQLYGVYWLLQCWKMRQSCILADDSGLGKYLQVIGMIHSIFSIVQKRGKSILILAPENRVHSLATEIEAWTGIYSIEYVGSAKDRRTCFDHEFRFIGVEEIGSSKFKPMLIITTLENSRDFSNYGIPWDTVIVDQMYCRPLPAMTKAKQTYLSKAAMWINLSNSSMLQLCTHTKALTEFKQVQNTVQTASKSHSLMDLAASLQKSYFCPVESLSAPVCIKSIGDKGSVMLEPSHFLAKPPIMLSRSRADVKWPNVLTDNSSFKSTYWTVGQASSALISNPPQALLEGMIAKANVPQREITKLFEIPVAHDCCLHTHIVKLRLSPFQLHNISQLFLKHHHWLTTLRHSAGNEDRTIAKKRSKTPLSNAEAESISSFAFEMRKLCLDGRASYRYIRDNLSSSLIRQKVIDVTGAVSSLADTNPTKRIKSSLSQYSHLPTFNLLNEFIAASPKLEALLDLLEKDRHASFVIMTQYRVVIDFIVDFLESLGPDHSDSFVRVDASLAKGEYSARMDYFHSIVTGTPTADNKKRILLYGCRAGSNVRFGTHLVPILRHIDNVVIFDGLLDQDGTHETFIDHLAFSRQSTRPVQVYRLIMQNSVEEAIWNNVILNQQHILPTGFMNSGVLSQAKTDFNNLKSNKNGQHFQVEFGWSSDSDANLDLLKLCGKWLLLQLHGDTSPAVGAVDRMYSEWETWDVFYGLLRSLLTKFLPQSLSYPSSSSASAAIKTPRPKLLGKQEIPGGSKLAEVVTSATPMGHLSSSAHSSNAVSRPIGEFLQEISANNSFSWRLCRMRLLDQLTPAFPPTAAKPPMDLSIITLLSQYLYIPVPPAGIRNPSAMLLKSVLAYGYFQWTAIQQINRFEDLTLQSIAAKVTDVLIALVYLTLTCTKTANNESIDDIWRTLGLETDISHGTKLALLSDRFPLIRYLMCIIPLNNYPPFTHCRACHEFLMESIQRTTDSFGGDLPFALPCCKPPTVQLVKSPSDIDSLKQYAQSLIVLVNERLGATLTDLHNTTFLIPAPYVATAPFSRTMEPCDWNISNLLHLLEFLDYGFSLQLLTQRCSQASLTALLNKHDDTLACGRLCIPVIGGVAQDYWILCCGIIFGLPILDNSLIMWERHLRELCNDTTISLALWRIDTQCLLGRLFQILDVLRVQEEGFDVSHVLPASFITGDCQHTAATVLPYPKYGNIYTHNSRSLRAKIFSAIKKFGKFYPVLEELPATHFAHYTLSKFVMLAKIVSPTEEAIPLKWVQETVNDMALDSQTLEIVDCMDTIRVFFIYNEPYSFVVHSSCKLAAQLPEDWSIDHALKNILMYGWGKWAKITPEITTKEKIFAAQLEMYLKTFARCYTELFQQRYPTIPGLTASFLLQNRLVTFAKTPKLATGPNS